jgi:hypothetical protein
MLLGVAEGVGDGAGPWAKEEGVRTKKEITRKIKAGIVRVRRADFFVVACWTVILFLWLCF